MWSIKSLVDFYLLGKIKFIRSKKMQTFFGIKTYTVNSRYNERLYNEMLDIANLFAGPGRFLKGLMGFLNRITNFRYNELRTGF